MIADVEVEQVALFHFIAGVAVVDVLPAAHDIAYRVTGDGIHLYAYPLCLNGFCYNRLSGLLGFAVHHRRRLECVELCVGFLSGHCGCGHEGKPVVLRAGKCLGSTGHIPSIQ